jgi:hypothetical protein
LLLWHGEGEICTTYSGLEEDLYITADAEAFVKSHGRPALLGGGNPRLADPPRRSLMARTGLPDMERPQDVRSHQARRSYRHRKFMLTSSDRGCRRGPLVDAQKARIGSPMCRRCSTSPSQTAR